jgi:hypothetical protein
MLVMMRSGTRRVTVGGAGLRRRVRRKMAAKRQARLKASQTARAVEYGRRARGAKTQA